ncbi:MAG TPA: hypothetical protein VIG24_15255 [Acidimicrobiia bacterium]
MSVDYVWSEPWRELRELITAVDSHRLVNGDPAEHDAALYETVASIRRRMS